MKSDCEKILQPARNSSSMAVLGGFVRLEESKNIEKASPNQRGFLHCASIGGIMYASQKQRHPQPSKEAVRELIAADVREHRPPRTQGEWRGFWHPDERARKQALS